ncbi:unnamed protein product, partial [Mesorhabditis spiculigera]
MTLTTVSLLATFYLVGFSLAYPGEAAIGRIFKRQVVNGGPACPPLTVLNGNVNYLQASLTQQYASGTTGTLACNLGFTPTGATSSTCQNGAWLPLIGSCTPATPLGGVAPIGGIGAPGGLGAPVLPGLGALQCGDILPPLNGAVTYSSPGALHPAGSTVTLTCNAGHVLSGTPTATCTNGAWNPALLGEELASSNASKPFKTT